MIDLSTQPSEASLEQKIERFWEASGRKILAIEKDFDRQQGAPVHTVGGRYVGRAWTEWTSGFEVGASLLQFDATGEQRFLELGRRNTVERMAPHVVHFGVHDHGFTIVSTYGTLLRLMQEGRIPANGWERAFYVMALKCSGAVQAYRWTKLGGGGFIHSFNGPHSLFADTVRSLRSLAVAHRLGGVLKGEKDERISLLDRLIKHLVTTERYTVYHGEDRDGYDVRGRVAHESLFNVTAGTYVCPATQQGYSPYSTWTRGLAWIICGFAEMLEYFETLSAAEIEAFPEHGACIDSFTETARAVCDFYIEHTPTCGVPYWDTGAPGLCELGDYLSQPANPLNDHEPVDSSAAAIAAQGMLRLGRYLGEDTPGSEQYVQAGLKIADTILSEPYINTGSSDHHGLLLHSIYHRPNRWDRVPPGRTVPCGESTMWGDYHARELVLYLQRHLNGETLPYFYNVGNGAMRSA